MTTICLNRDRNLSDLGNKSSAINNLLDDLRVTAADVAATEYAAQILEPNVLLAIRESRGNFQSQIEGLESIAKGKALISSGTFIKGGSITAASFRINGVGLGSQTGNPWTAGNPLSYGGKVMADKFFCQSISFPITINTPGDDTGKAIRLVVKSNGVINSFVAKLNQ